MTTYLTLLSPGLRIRQLLLASVSPTSTVSVIDRCQRIEQIADVEADFDFLAAEFDFKLVLGLFLLRVVCLDRQQPGGKGQPHAAVFFVREDRCALQSGAHRLARGGHHPRRQRRDHAAIFWELAVNELRSEANFSDLDANVISSDGDFDLALSIQQALQLQYTLARQDDLLQLPGFAAKLDFTPGQAMPVGGHRAQRLAIGFQQACR